MRQYISTHVHTHIQTNMFIKGCFKKGMYVTR